MSGPVFLKYDHLATLLEFANCNMNRRNGIHGTGSGIATWFAAVSVANRYAVEGLAVGRDTNVLHSTVRNDRLVSTCTSQFSSVHECAEASQ